ncbi:ORF6C domain-containing protein [Clostridium butyricum]
MYKLIFKSKKAEAERFQDWVTDEVLPQIRKTGSYQIPKMSKELEAILMIDGKQQKRDERITKLENNTTIDYSQQEDLRELANKKIVAILGGTDAPAYRELNKKVFSNFWRDYKRKLNVNSYKNTLVKD